MKLKRMQEVLAANADHPLHFMLPKGEVIPAHFHVTEVGRVHKTFVDCGGTHRESLTCLLQVWSAQDVEHRLTTAKLGRILKLSEPILGSADLEVEVEYGSEVAALYTLEDCVVNGDGVFFVLDGKPTQCLASDKCGIKPCGVCS
ncbi:MAG TPA: DUF6428 family protein [Urbifossiella sp.]|jgi:hypothetical protein